MFCRIGRVAGSLNERIRVDVREYDQTLTQTSLTSAGIYVMLCFVG